MNYLPSTSYFWFLDALPTASLRSLLIPRHGDAIRELNNPSRMTYAQYICPPSQTIDTFLVEQVTILNGVTAGWAVTNTNSDHDGLWRVAESRPGQDVCRYHYVSVRQNN